MPILDAIRAHHGELTCIRRDLHQHPELGYEEVRTAGVVVEQLRRFGVDEVHTGIGRTGVVAVVRGREAGDGRAVALRADMDALPIVEENGFAHRSRHHGKMHGCGHDGHTTMLLGAAQYLAKTRRFTGSACLFFQPGEEGHAGAQAMIEDGLFDRFPVDAVYALHNWPSLPAGVVGLNHGPMMAAIDRFSLRILGVGGHGAHPHQAVDPIVAACQIVTAMQSIVSRNVNPLDSAVISLHALQAGKPSALSVIPDVVEIAGMVKWYRKPVQEILERRLRTVCETGAAALGARAELAYEALYPPTVNTPGEAERVMRVASGLVGADNVRRDLEPSMGSEDFAFMLQRKPGAYFRLGTGGEHFLHNPRYEFNDDVIPIGAAVLAGIVEDSLPLR
jgi:amidohydrolase